MGPALQEEGGSLCIPSQPVILDHSAKSLRRRCALAPCFRRLSCEQPNGEARGRWGGNKVHVPTEVSELLVDTLESHGDVFCVVLRVVLCGSGGAVLRRECGWVVKK